MTQENNTWLVYMVRCSDGTLYTGITNDLERRLAAHNSGRDGARYTKSRRPVKLVYAEAAGSHSAAARLEYRIKKMGRTGKKELAAAGTASNMDQKKNGRPGFDRRMSKTEINCCPILRWEGRTIVVRDSAGLERAMRKLAGESLLGFDTETRPAYRKGESYQPSLLQLAGRDEVFIFQLQHLGLAAPLRCLLADPGIIKAGVSLDFDISELQKLSRFRAAGFFDLGNFAKETGIRNHGLRGLAAVLLGIRIAKGEQTSNWARETLTPKQVLYAATDAWIGRRLYLAMQKVPGSDLGGEVI